ncbi:MAG: glycine cleavage system protein GcvH [Chitinispirillales bacterium]|jgi:glycine cleavage system H protein|nr:glycine cleavage system protein GcvH [Chitinispirillales bacterium]
MNPNDLKYSKTHEWVKLGDGGIAKIGITHHAQDTLGDITFVDLPKVGASLKKEGEAGVIESVKAASDLLSPVTGEVTAVNDAIASAPESINSDPYGAGWLYAVKVADQAEIDGLMDVAAYEKFLETE